MSKKTSERKIVYIDRPLPKLIKLYPGQQLVLANSFDNFQRNYAIVKSRITEEHFTRVIEVGICPLREARKGTYSAETLVVNDVAAEGELSIDLGYSHIQKAEETKTTKYRIIQPRKSKKSR